MSWIIVSYIVYGFLALASLWVIIKRKPTGIKIMGIGGLILSFMFFAPHIGIVIANNELETILGLGSILLIGIGMIIDK